MEGQGRSSGRAEGRGIGSGPRYEASRAGHYGRKPVLFAVDGGSESFRTIQYELRKRYGNDYRLMSESSARWGLKRLEELKASGEEVALVLADQWMPDMSGAELLARVRNIFPTAKRALLQVWGDRTTQQPILQSMTLGHIDYYVHKPERPGDEHFHRMVSEFLYEWAATHRPGFHEIRVIGEQWSARSHELRDILRRNGILHEFYPPDHPKGEALLARVGRIPERLPVVVLYDGTVLEDPSNVELADAFGINRSLRHREFDLVIVGAGPAGLAAAVYGASEGLSTLVLEGEAVGGQAGSSSLIRNYLGFPWGVGGAELARRAAEQAWWFGAIFHFMRHATGLRREAGKLVVSLSDGTEVVGGAVIVATGASYRRLDVPALEALVGSGVFYGAAVSEAQAMKDKSVYVVGGANSAGQAAMHLSKYASRVTLVVRGSSLTKSMSAYLVEEIRAASNVDVRFDARVVEGSGEGRLERLVLEDRTSGRRETVPAAALFVLIGAEPRTGWLPEEVVRDEQGYVVTGQDLVQPGRFAGKWPLQRPPLLFESSLPGVFAAGDLRRGSVKRVASAVGAGAIAVHLVHEYFIESSLGADDPGPTSTRRPDFAGASGSTPGGGGAA